MVCHSAGPEGHPQAFRHLVDLYDRRLLYFVRRILGETDGVLGRPAGCLADRLPQAPPPVLRGHLSRLGLPDRPRSGCIGVAQESAVSRAVCRCRHRTACGRSWWSKWKRSRMRPGFTPVLPGLSVDHRRVLALRFMEGMSIEEIAEVVGGSAGTVKSRLYYAKAALAGAWRSCVMTKPGERTDLAARTSVARSVSE